MNIYSNSSNVCYWHQEAASLQREEEERIKIQKEEALQLLKKKEKTENMIKVHK